MLGRRLLRLLALAMACAAVAAAPATASAAPRQAGACAGADAEPSASTGLAQTGRTVLCLLNAERGRAGLRPLIANRRLARAAVAHSRDMVRRRFFGHDAPGGSTMATRIRRAGYLRGARAYVIGENIAWGSGSLATPRSIVDAWLRSPGHRRNILSPAFREIGIGIALGAPASARGATYTTDFGTRR